MISRVETSRRLRPRILAALLITLPAAAESTRDPEAEFHLGRLVYASNQGQRAWRPWWAIDENTLIGLQGDLRILRVRIGSDEPEVLFPRGEDR